MRIVKELVNEIEGIDQKIQNNLELYRSGRSAEPNVKGHLIRPILRALGWTVETPSVQEDYTVDSGFVDFVLLKEDEPVLVVEAKAMGKNVSVNSPHLSQLIDYLIDLDLYFGILTNGRMWSLYSRSGRRAAHEWSVDFLQESADYCAGLLWQISVNEVANIKGHLESMKERIHTLESSWERASADKELMVRSLARALQEWILKEDDKSEITVFDTEYYLRERYRDTTDIVAAGPPPPRPQIIIAGAPVRLIRAKKQVKEGLSGWKAVLKGRELPAHGHTPYQIRIGNESSIEVTSWPDVMVATAEWLIHEGHLNKDKCPFPTGPKWHQRPQMKALINNVPMNPDGTRMRNMKRLSEGLFLCTKYNAYQSMELSWFMMEVCGLDSTILNVSWR